MVDHTRRAAWSTEVFDDIEWRRFEAVIERLMTQSGMSARTQSHGADGGVDIWLYSQHVAGPVTVVQCKAWHTKPIGVREVREFFGVMAANHVQWGTYATTSVFTEPALDFARSNHISALDRRGLLDLIERRTPAQQTELLDVAYEGEYWVPTCARCGIKMTLRTNPKDGTQFWGCKNYRRGCRSTIQIAKA